MQQLKEVYAYLEEKVDDKVFARGKWVIMTSEAINKIIGPPDHEEDECLVLVDEGVRQKSWIRSYAKQTKKLFWSLE